MRLVRSRGGQRRRPTFDQTGVPLRHRRDGDVGRRPLVLRRRRGQGGRSLPFLADAARRRETATAHRPRRRRATHCRSMSATARPEGRLAGCSLLRPWQHRRAAAVRTRSRHGDQDGRGEKVSDDATRPGHRLPGDTQGAFRPFKLALLRINLCGAGAIVNTIAAAAAPRRRSARYRCSSHFFSKTRIGSCTRLRESWAHTSEGQSVETLPGRRGKAVVNQPGVEKPNVQHVGMPRHPLERSSRLPLGKAASRRGHASGRRAARSADG